MERSDRLQLKFFNTNDHDVEKFPNIIRDVVEEIWEKGSIGLLPEYIQIAYYYYKQYKFPEDGSDGKLEDKLTNHFLLEVPYAGRTIKWDLILKSHSGYIPDFMFDDDFQENPDTDVISQHLPSIVNWTPKRHSLVNVLKELMKLYKEFNVSKLEHQDLFYIKLEYEELLTGNRFLKEDIEVLVRSNFVHILVLLNFNSSCLPPFAQKEEPAETSGLVKHPHEDTAALQFSFNTLNLKVDTVLILPPRLERVLGNSKTLQIPTYSSVGGVVDYVTLVETLLEDRVKDISDGFRKRNEFVTTILKQSGFAIIEYDKTLFSMITLLYDFDGTYVVVLINIPDKFPDEQPLVTLLSIYLTSHSKPQKLVNNSYPYSPRWKPQEMLERIIKYVEDEITNIRIA